MPIEKDQIKKILISADFTETEASDELCEAIARHTSAAYFVEHFADKLFFQNCTPEEKLTIIAQVLALKKEKQHSFSSAFKYCPQQNRANYFVANCDKLTKKDLSSFSVLNFDKPQDRLRCVKAIQERITSVHLLVNFACHLTDPDCVAVFRLKHEVIQNGYGLAHVLEILVDKMRYGSISRDDVICFIKLCAAKINDEHQLATVCKVVPDDACEIAVLNRDKILTPIELMHLFSVLAEMHNLQAKGYTDFSHATGLMYGASFLYPYTHSPDYNGDVFFKNLRERVFASKESLQTIFKSGSLFNIIEEEASKTKRDKSPEATIKLGQGSAESDFFQRASSATTAVTNIAVRNENATAGQFLNVASIEPPRR